MLLGAQRDGGVHACRPPGRDPARQERRGGEEQRHGDEGRGVVRRHGVEEAGEQAPGGARAEEADAGAGEVRTSPRPTTSRSTWPALAPSAMRTPISCAPPRHRVGDDAVDPEDRERQGEGGEGGEERPRKRGSASERDHLSSIVAAAKTARSRVELAHRLRAPGRDGGSGSPCRAHQHRERRGRELRERRVEPAGARLVGERRVNARRSTTPTTVAAALAEIV